MAMQRGPDGAEPIRGDAIERVSEPREEAWRRAQPGRLATGTLACPACDAPVAPGPVPLIPGGRLRCPVCDHSGRVREFLSLIAPARAARVVVRVIGSAADA